MDGRRPTEREHFGWEQFGRFERQRRRFADQSSSQTRIAND